MGGRTYYTRRTYWAFMEKVIHWALISGHLRTILRSACHRSTGSSTRSESTLIECRVKTTCGLSLTRVANWRGSGSRSQCFWARSGRCASANLLALRRRNIRCVAQEGLWLTIDSQIRRYPRRYSDDGKTATDFAPPKGRPTASGGRRRCYVPHGSPERFWGTSTAGMPSELLFLNA